MNSSTKGKWLIGIGIVFSVMALISTTIPLIGTAVGIMFGNISWILLIAGLALWVSGRRRITTLGILKRLGFSRHDIIKSTNWVRSGIFDFINPIGTSLIVIGIILLIIELIFGEPYPLLPLWIIIIIAGAILLVWKPYIIIHDHTKKILVKIPDLLSIHTFHTNLRQCLEDAGYVISESVSPGENSSASSFNNNISLLNGGIRGFKKSTSPSKLLIPELAKSSIISNIFTSLGLGILSMLLGFTLVIRTMTTWRYEKWVSGIEIIAFVLLFFGIALLIYDYITRTRRLGQIYIIEEGTAYIPTINIYDHRILDKPGYETEPNISFVHTSCELIITVGTTRNRFFELNILENDFNNIVDSIEKIKSDNALNVKDITL